jgi:signal transduction histidine kinase
VRFRLVGTYLVLLALVLLALEVPLAAYVAASRTEQAVLDRFVDAARFASLADPALRDDEGGALLDELNRYHDLYGISVAVADRDGRTVMATGDRAAFGSPDARDRIQQALAGERVGATGTIWPWQPGPLTVAVPVTSGGEVIGAVVSLSPTATMRADVERVWLLLAVAGLAAGVVFVYFALTLVRWITEPVAALGGAAARLSAGALDARVPAGEGPAELRALAQSFNAMADSVADALARQRAFVSQASHQLRNPLTALRLSVEELGEFITPATTCGCRAPAGGPAAVRAPVAAPTPVPMTTPVPVPVPRRPDPSCPAPPWCPAHPAVAVPGRPVVATAACVEAAAPHAPPTPGREAHRLALEETDRLGRILDGLLALARAERGQHVREAVDAAMIADERVAAWQPLAEQRGVALVRAGSLSALASAVPTAVGQALDALIDNAVKFAGRGATVRVEVHTFRTSVDLHVVDDGPGLSDEGRRRATERFWRAPDAQNVDGSGLGLPIVSALLEASAGRLDLLPAHPHGLDARLRFPTVRARH